MLPVQLDIANVKTLATPIPNGLANREGEKLDKGMKINDTAAERIDSIGAGLPLHGIEFPEETKVWLDFEPVLTKRDETRNVKKGIGR